MVPILVILACTINYLPHILLCRNSNYQHTPCAKSFVGKIIKKRKSTQVIISKNNKLETLKP